MASRDRAGRDASKSQAALRLGVQVGRQRAALGSLEIVLQVGDVDGPDDGGVEVRMAEGEAQDELHARHAVQQLVQACALPQLPGFVLPSLLRRGAASDSASNDHARPCFCCPRYDRLVFALERRVGDLENVEHAHGDMVLQVRQGGGHANEADLALLLEVEDGPNGVVFLKRLLGGAAVELQDIYIIRLHACQALMNTGQDVLARVDVSRSEE